MPHYLVVANRTLGGPDLLDTIRDRMTRGPAHFWVLVPATSVTHLMNDFTAWSGAFPVDPTIAPSAADLAVDAEAGRSDVSEATARLHAELAHLHAIGARAEGAVGDPDPLRAIEAALMARPVDEIILSTLPPGLSRWLALDLPHRIRRRTEIPLTVVTAEPLTPPPTVRR